MGESSLPEQGRLRHRIGEQGGRQAWEGRGGEGRMGGRMRGMHGKASLAGSPSPLSTQGEPVRGLDTGK